MPPDTTEKTKDKRLRRCGEASGKARTRHGDVRPNGCANTHRTTVPLAFPQEEKGQKPRRRVGNARIRASDAAEYTAQRSRRSAEKACDGNDRAQPVQARKHVCVIARLFRPWCGVQIRRRR